MNDLDRQLIALLRENARMPVVALAKKLRVARATVQNRIARLEQEGVIVGYTLRLKPEEEVHQIRAIMSLAVESNREEAVMRQLRGHVSVVTLHSVNGRWDLVAELRLDTLGHSRRAGHRDQHRAGHLQAVGAGAGALRTRCRAPAGRPVPRCWRGGPMRRCGAGNGRSGR